MPKSHHNTHEFVELRHNVSGEHIITDELDDFHFDMGYRFVRYVPNSQVNYPTVVEYQENLALEQLKNSPADPYIYTDVLDANQYTDEYGNIVTFFSVNNLDSDGTDKRYVSQPEIY